MDSPTSPLENGTTPPPKKVRRGPASWLPLMAEVALVGAALTYAVVRHPEWIRSALVFLLVLGVLVFVHEWGHYQFARWAGMKVNRFGIGFPPWIFNIRRNNIDYSIGALPIGGMVDIAGLGSEEEMVGSAKGLEAPAPVRDTSRPFGEKQFQDAGLGWRFWTLFAGPFMNFLFAIVAFIVVYSVAGLPVPHLKPQIEKVMVKTPAAQAGLQAKDAIEAVNGKPVENTEQVTKIIRGGKGEPLTLKIKRGEETLERKVTPTLRDLDGDGKQEPSIGIVFNQNNIASFTFVRLDPWTAIQSGFLQSAGVSLSILDTIKRLVTRQLTSEESEGIGGPVKIAQVTSQVSQHGFFVALHFAAMLSVNLGLMNLLPLPALDGGRILFLGYELVMRRPFDARKEGLVHMAGMILLLAFMLLITLRDIRSL